MLQQQNNILMDIQKNNSFLCKEIIINITNIDDEDIMKSLIKNQSDGMSDIYKRIVDTITDDSTKEFSFK